MKKILHIFLCEDEKFFLHNLEEQIRKYLREIELQKNSPKNLQFQIHTFHSGEDLLKSDLDSIHLLFLDINLGGIGGIELAQILQKRNPDIILIFVSGYIQYAPIGYEVKAFRYLLKSQLKLTFEKTMYDALFKLGYFTPQLQFIHNTENAVFYWNEILYVESHLHYMNFHFSKENETIKINSNVNGTLNHLEQMLPIDTYIRIHQSYLVNIHHITEIKDFRVFLSDESILPASQKKFTSAKRKFYLYKGAQ